LAHAPSRHARRGAWVAGCLTCSLVAAAPPPAAGRYAAQLCVTVAGAEPACGPAEIDWIDRHRARLRISDVVYALRLRAGQIDVVLKHGAMQIDGFTAVHEWEDMALRFADPDKNVRYEIRSEARLRVKPKPALTPRPTTPLGVPSSAPQTAPTPASLPAATRR
jgi:hypothetical protein